MIISEEYEKLKIASSILKKNKYFTIAEISKEFSIEDIEAKNLLIQLRDSGKIEEYGNKWIVKIYDNE